MPAFGDDDYLRAEVERLIAVYGIRSVIETGTHLGDTAAALCGMAERVVTIESNETYWLKAFKNLKRFDHCDRMLGRSQDLLPMVIGHTMAPRLYYLDAHWGDDNPLLRELEIIAELDERPVIVIHDMKVPGRDFGFDAYKGQDYCYEWVEPQLTKLRCRWIHYFNEQANGHKRGVLFVAPCLAAS